MHGLITRILIIAASTLLLGCLGDLQDHEVEATEQPHYTLWGTVLDGVDLTPIPHAKVVITMTFSYADAWIEGNWVQRDTIVTDTSGQYSVDSLDLGQYQIEVFRENELRYLKSIDFFQYSDREFDIIVPGPPHIDLKGTVTRCTTPVKVSEVQLTLTPIELLNGAVMIETGAPTNSVGSYAIRNVYPGFYVLKGLKWNYYPYTKYITIEDNGSGVFEFDFCMGYMGSSVPTSNQVKTSGLSFD